MWLKWTFRSGRYCLVWAVLALSLVWALAVAPAHAAMPLAGDSIINVAGGTYFYNTREIRTNSNTVITQVAEKSGVVLASDQTKSVLAGGWVYFSHVLTNTGNAADRYTLQVSDLVGEVGSFSEPNGCKIFVDGDRNNMPDDPGSPLAEGVCTGTGVSYTLPDSAKLASGASYNFVVGLQAKANASAGQRAELTVKAISFRDATDLKANTDKADVVTGEKGFFEVLKTVDKSSAGPGELLTYTFRITNYGAVGGTTITDEIGKAVAVGTTLRWSTEQLEYYVPPATENENKPKWDGVGVLTDADDGADHTVANRATLKYSALRAAGIVTVKIALTNVQPNYPQIITFKVKVKDDAKAGEAQSKNMAKYNVAGADALTGECAPGDAGCRSTYTNSATTTVKPKYKVVVNGSAPNADGAPPNPFPGADTTAGTPNATDDTAILESPVGEVIPGARLRFKSYVWNRGNAEDIVRLSVSGTNTFPSGTAIVFFEEDGVRPLPFGRTPPIAPNKSFPFVTVVLLPSNASGGPFSVDVTGTSTKDIAESPSHDAVNIRLAPLQAGKLELAHDLNGTIKSATAGGLVTTCTLPSGAAAGICANETGAPPVPLNPPGGSVLGTTQVVFPLFVRSSLARTYALSVAAKADFTELVDGANWEVKFYAPEGTNPVTCVESGALKVQAQQIVSFFHTGGAGPEDSKRFVLGACAVVTKKSGALADVQHHFYFKVRDIDEPRADAQLHDRVIVPSKNLISVSPASAIGQVFKDSESVDYQYLLRNEGNADLSCKFTPTFTGGRLGWTAALLLDRRDQVTAGAGAPTVPAAAEFVPVPFGSPFSIPDPTHYVGATGAGSTSTGGVLGSGKALRLILRVTAVAGDLDRVGLTDRREVTITPTDCGAGVTTAPGPQSTVATTTVTDGKLKVELTQAADPTCTGSPAANTYTSQPLGRGTQEGVKPGGCVCYRVVAKNEGTAATDELTKVRVTNPIPAYTRLKASATCVTTPVGLLQMADEPNVLGTADSTTAQLKCTVATLTNGQSVEMKFCVKIDDSPRLP